MNHVWRLTFGYDGDAYTLVSMRRLRKRVPPGTAAAVAARRAVELRDAQHQVLYRRDIGALVPETVEHPTGDPARPLGRVALRRRREVSLWIPALPQGHSVAIVAAPARHDAPARSVVGAVAPEAARDLISVELPASAAATGEPQ